MSDVLEPGQEKEHPGDKRTDMVVSYWTLRIHRKVKSVTLIRDSPSVLRGLWTSLTPGPVRD